MDNIFVAYELFHYLHGHKGTHEVMDLKLDVSKAFDRVKWAFLDKIM